MAYKTVLHYGLSVQGLAMTIDSLLSAVWDCLSTRYIVPPPPFHLWHVFFSVWAWYILPVQQLHSCPWKQSLRTCQAASVQAIIISSKGNNGLSCLLRSFPALSHPPEIYDFFMWQNNTSKEWWVTDSIKHKCFFFFTLNVVGSTCRPKTV